jgi:hypothetical protein
MFVTVIYFHPSLILQARLEPTQVELKGRVLALPANISLGWKGPTVANATTYYDI